MATQELFAIDLKPTLTPADQAKAARLKDRIADAQSLGLKTQVQSLRRKLVSVKKGGRIATLPMTKNEVLIWGVWLPMTYKDRSDRHNEYERQLSEYGFDQIPGHVLKLWKKYKEQKLFQRFEIWTPENPRPDPILVGINGESSYLLARWGESDANLVSFEDIKREIMRRWNADDDFPGNLDEDEPGGYSSWDRIFRAESAFLWGACAAVVTAVTAIFLGFYFGIPVKESSPLTVVLAAAAGAIVARRRYLYKTVQLMKLSPIAKAVLSDDTPERKQIPAN